MSNKWQIIFGKKSINPLLLICLYQLITIVRPSPYNESYTYQMSSILLFVTIVLILSQFKDKQKLFKEKNDKYLLKKVVYHIITFTLIILSEQLNDKSITNMIKAAMVSKLFQNISMRIHSKQATQYENRRNIVFIILTGLFLIALIIIVIIELPQNNDLFFLLSLMVLDWMLRLLKFLTLKLTIKQDKNLTASTQIKKKDYEEINSIDLRQLASPRQEINEIQPVLQRLPLRDRESTIQLQGIYNKIEQLQIQPSGISRFYEVLLCYFQDGIMILDEDKNLIVSSPSLLKLTNCDDYKDALSFTMKLQNCSEEFKKQSHLNALLNDAMKKLSRENIFEEVMQENILLQNIEMYDSDSPTVKVDFEKSVDSIKNVPQLNKIKLIYMLCSVDGQIQADNESKMGDQRLFSVSIRPFIFQNRVLVFLQIRDVTHFNQIRALQGINDNKTKMLEWVSHEFRTPLNCIILMIQSLMDMSEQEIIDEFLQPVLTSAKALLSLIQDILDVAQIRAGKFQLAYEEFDLIVLIEELRSLLLPNLSLKGNQLEIQLSSNIPRFIISDQNRIRQILINLIGNASKFTENGTIIIGINALRPGFLEIYVQDDGLGIAQEDQNKLFKAFGKLENGMNMNAQGVGLGLMISNILAEKLSLNQKKSRTNPKSTGEGLKVFSEGLGKGSKFSFVISTQNQSHRDGNCKSDFLYSESFRIQESCSDFKFNFRQLQSKTLQRISSQSSNCQIQSSNKKIYGLEPNSVNIIKQSKYSSSQQKETSKESLRMIGSQKLNENEFICNCPEILIVDDEPFNIQALKGLLKSFNFIIEESYSGMDAINKVKQNNCTHRESNGHRIIFMDVEMPGMSGLKTTEEILKLKPNQFIVGLTGHSSKSIENQTRKVGMKSVITKPITRQQINTLIKQVIDQDDH